MQTVKKITSKQQVAIINLLSSSSIEESAKKTGISKSTLYKWLADEKFKQELSNKYKRIAGGMMAKLKTFMPSLQQ